MLTSSLVALLLFASGQTAVCAAPPGMRCVAGGAVDVGEGAFARAVNVDAFFVDVRAVSVADLAACVQAGHCTKPGKAKDGSALADWFAADRACAMLGKRLPSEAEWTAAAIDNATVDGGEWTATWFVKAESCTTPSEPIPSASKYVGVPPALCGAQDVKDPCDGAVMCGSLSDRVTKTSTTPAARARGIAAASPRSFRCVSSTPTLATYPSRYTAQPLSAPPALTAPTPEQLTRFRAVTPDVLEVPNCEKPGRSFIDCRDPRSYLKTNEPHLDVVVPYVTNLGGGYTGVASDQNYTLIALARSQWAWLFDYDANVVTWHQVLLAIIAGSADRGAFVDAFAFGSDASAAGRARDAAVLAALARDRPADEGAALQKFFKSNGPRLLSNYRKQLSQPFTWLGSDEHFSWINTLVEQGRIIAVRGNMLDKNAMTSIGAAAKAVGVPMRIYYPSNAPEFWVFSDQYRANVAALPFDDQSIVVQTISGMKSGFDQVGYWHYNIQWGREQQRLLRKPGYTRLKQLLHHRIRGESGDITLSGLPAQ
jgi:hypothetical protein